MNTPIKVDFIGKGNIWVDNTYDDSVINLTRYIICNALQNTAPGQLSVVGYDSDLSGIFAPFASLSAGNTKQLEYLSDEKEFEKYLDHLWEHIQAVQNVIQGRTKDLIGFRKLSKRPVEGYKLVVLSLDLGMINQELRTKLSFLMRRGPAAGVSFLIVSTTLISISLPNGKEFELSVETISPNITILEPFNDTVSDQKTGKTVRYTPLSANYIINQCESFEKNMESAQLPVVLFDELHDLNRQWQYSSIDGLTFCVGKYGIDNMEITIGDDVNQRHNVIITGAVGQGKSNLISVIIHSLCLRYSPKELNLYLLDFKEGVSFKPFSNIGQDAYLPHAKALGLESDVSFGLAVLESLFRIYQKRMKILKDHNYKSIRELRLNHPETIMPRIAVVIDEFQMMFGDDNQTGQQIAEMLEKSVRLFRAAGIHFILASQTLGGNMALVQKHDSIFSQV
ncbi:MAG: FtsK/SpoIIIE domain-containing protein, partial [Clostridia bacterium]